MSSSSVNFVLLYSDVFFCNNNQLSGRVLDWRVTGLRQCVVSLSKTLYGKCSKILNTFLSLFSNKIMVFRAGIHKFLVRVANREDPDQTASLEAV